MRKISNFELRIANLKCKRKEFILILFLIFALIIPSKAQSVDSLINEALINNPQLKALEARIKSAEYKSETTGYLPPPSLEIEFEQVPFEDPNPFTQALSQNLSLSQMFMLGGKLSAMTEAEKKNISIAQSDYDAFRLQLISEITTNYYEIWRIEHHLELRDEIEDMLNSLLKSNEQLYTTGNTKYSDLLMVKAELASNKTQSNVLEDELAAAFYKMNALVGRDLENKELTVQHNWKIDSLKYSSDELIASLGNLNPKLLKMDRMMEMNRLEIIANNKELVPDLMLQGMVMRMPRGMVLTTTTPVHQLDGMGETEYMYSLMASVTLPFAPWSSGKYKNKEQELTASIEGLSSEKYNMQREMASELQGMLKKLESSNKQIQLYEKEVIPLYKEALQAQLTEFQSGRTSINQLISTIQMLIMKEEELSESQMQHQMALGEIEKMTGQRLFGKR